MRKLLASLAFALAVLPMTAKAGIPVIDVTAVFNLIQQVGYWQQQIGAMANQLTVATVRTIATRSMRDTEDVRLIVEYG